MAKNNGTHLAAVAGTNGVQQTAVLKLMLWGTAKDLGRDSGKMLITRVEKDITTLAVLVAKRHGNSQGRALAKHLGSHPVSAKAMEREESPVSAARRQRRAVAKQMYPETQMVRPSL